MRRLLALAAAMAGASALAQIPDVTIKVDAGLTYRSVRNGETTLRWYDGFGKHSTVGLLFWLEPGWRVYVSERLQRIEGDGDNEQLDEYYVEDPGIWRLGKQYLPFGRGLLLRESARAARPFDATDEVRGRRTGRPGHQHVGPVGGLAREQPRLHTGRQFDQIGHRLAGAAVGRVGGGGECAQDNG